MFLLKYCPENEVNSSDWNLYWLLFALKLNEIFILSINVTIPFWRIFSSKTHCAMESLRAEIHQ